MRPILFLPALLIAAPVAAQEMSGSVTLRTTDESSGTVMDMTLHMDGDRTAMMMEAPDGPMAGSAMRVVSRQGSNTMTMFVTMPGMPGGMKGAKIVQEIKLPDTEGEVGVKPLGTTQTIAGHQCDDYEVTTEDGVYNICGASSLDGFTFPAASPGALKSSRWARAFPDKPIFPLKVWDGKGVALEVTSIVLGAVDPAVFDLNPPGYMTLPTMPGMPNLMGN